MPKENTSFQKTPPQPRKAFASMLHTSPYEASMQQKRQENVALSQDVQPQIVPAVTTTES